MPVVTRLYQVSKRSYFCRYKLLVNNDLHVTLAVDVLLYDIKVQGHSTPVSLTKKNFAHQK